MAYCNDSMSERDRIIFHIDVNSAYLSWEAVHRIRHGETIDLRDIPSVVGGDPSTRHGIVLAKSIPAKMYKIQTGEPLFSARLKCPNLVVVPPRYSLYIKYSSNMLKILQEYSPVIERFSIDEVFIDFTGMERHFGPPVKAAYTIKDRIKNELGFTVNIGISCNKLLAKMASELEKPDRVHTLFPEEIPQKMWPLPVGELFMVGRTTAQKLKRKGIFTIGQLAALEPALLRQWFKSYGELIWEFAHGIDNSEVQEYFPMKGLSNSTTISFDVKDRDTAHKVLLSLSETLGMRLRKAGKCARLVGVSIKNKYFQTCSRQRKFDIATDCTNEIYRKARELFDELWDGVPIRHLGVRVAELCSNKLLQLSFFDEGIDKYKALDYTVDNIRSKYGWHSIIRSCFLYSPLSPMAGGVPQDDLDTGKEDKMWSPFLHN